MTPPILVTGGTGTLGHQVVARLQAAGREIRVLSRRSRSSQDGLVFATGDLATGEGLAAAVRGTGTIVHCASNRKGDAEATRNLVRAAAQEKPSQAASPHLVYISIVGMIRMYLPATGRRLRPVVPVWTPGIGPIRAGALYPRPGTEVTLGRRSWFDFLAEKPADRPA
jgi:nucleoside-diphosphate-sugar epimerase